MSNHLVLDPGSNTIKCNVASYIDFPENQLSASGWETDGGFVPLENANLKKIQSIKNGQINHAKCFHDLLFHATIKKFGISRIKNDYLVAVLMPLSWSKLMIEETAQYMFEVCNFSGLVFIEQPLATLYGYGATSGLVLDLGYDKCGTFNQLIVDITAIFENNVVRYAAISLPVGGKDILKHLEFLLLQDADFKNVWKQDSIQEKFLKEILETPDLIVGIHNGESDPKQVQINGINVPISSKIRVSCLDVLFDPTIAGKDIPSLPEAMSECVRASGEPEKRLFLWENIALSGGLAAISCIKDRIEAECAIYLAASETSSEFQAKELGWMKIPDYFTNFRERPQDMGYVGGSVTAKCTLISPANYITRVSFMNN